ncbi:MAG: heat-inducible transcription repressor HrcA [Clostridiales bacterium]|nr:heat-inducible transcription repressor HrcA [Clostridiales bacterium]
MVELDNRKLTILKAIIKNYLETGEPVGSRTISKYTDLNLSSATIRNEMADLEDLGYIMQPHTSAGRIPSDTGYRLYVDDMMKEEKKEINEMKDFLIEKVDTVERLLQQMAQLLAANTNYATMISSPHYDKNKIKFIQLSKFDDKKLLAVVVVEGNIVRNTILDLDEDIDEVLDNDAILKLNMICNTSLNGLSVNEINLSVISKLKENAGPHSKIIEKVLDAVAETINIDEDLKIYTTGATNLFKYPELKDQEMVSNLVHTFEEKKLLQDLISNTIENDENHGDIQVYIGDETLVKSMKDYSVVTTTYELEEGVRGTICIIGPKRMDYEKAVNSLKTLTNQLDNIYKKT